MEFNNHAQVNTGKFNNHAQVNGTVKVIMHLTHGDTIAEFESVSEERLPLGTSSTVQILRKNHKVLLRINGVDTIEKISVNFTESKFFVHF